MRRRGLPERPTGRPHCFSCNDGTCCMLNTRRYVYSDRIDSVRADLLEGSFATTDPYTGPGLLFKEPQPPNANYPVMSALICHLSFDKVRGLSAIGRSSSGNYDYKYVVWGKVFYDPDGTSYSATRNKYMYIERIEKVK